MLCLPFTVICWPVTFLAWQVRAEPQWILQCLLSLLLFHAYLFFFFVLQRFSLCSWISLLYINSIIKNLCDHLISITSSFSHQILFFLIKSISCFPSGWLDWSLSFRVMVWNSGRKWTYKTNSKILKDLSNYHQWKRETAGLNRGRSSSGSDWEHPLFVHTHFEFISCSM